jgi:hypothetical protein
VHRLDALQQRRFSLGVCRRRAARPSVETSLRHAEHARHCSNWECGLVCAHEPEDPDGSVPVSRANQAAPQLRLRIMVGRELAAHLNDFITRRLASNEVQAIVNGG